MARRKRKPAVAPPKRYLEGRYALELQLLDSAHDCLQPLASSRLSPLPARMQTAIGRMVITLAGYRRELARFGEQVMLEKAEEDGVPVGPMPPGVDAYGLKDRGGD